MSSTQKKTVKKCGVKFDPPTLMLIYLDTSQNKLRRRSIPLRDFTKETNVNDFALLLRTSKKHKDYLESLPNRQLYKLLQIILDHMNGQSLEECLKKADELNSIDPEEDLNKVDDDLLVRKKAIMNDTFEKHAIRPGDLNYTYDVEVDFEAAVVESSGWDSDTDDSF